MFRWDREKAIDFACIDGITIPEIAQKLGTSVSSLEKFYNRNRAELFAARNETSVSDAVYSKVMELWGEQYSREEIAVKTGLTTGVVRRLILSAEHDEEPADLGAGLELLALQTEHPNRFYEDVHPGVLSMEDVRALVDAPSAGFGHREYVTPFSEDRPHRMALPAPSKRRPVTLAAAA